MVQEHSRCNYLTRIGLLDCSTDASTGKWN